MPVKRILNTLGVRVEIGSGKEQHMHALDSLLVGFLNPSPFLLLVEELLIVLPVKKAVSLFLQAGTSFHITVPYSEPVEPTPNLHILRVNIF
jgi:hypothetical protein